jgi:antitoxin component YwqK of YwqJK toxin-antitoxin module
MNQLCFMKLEIQIRQSWAISLVLFLCFHLSWSQPNQTYTKYYYPNGNISSEGTIENGKPNGYWKTYYSNGQMKSEGNRKEFLLDSTWKFYRDNGSLSQLITYKNDLKEGVEILYDSLENKMKSFTYHANVKDGEYAVYFKSGKLKEQGKYENNALSGILKEFDENDGRIITKTTYKNGLIYNQEFLNRYDAYGRKVGFWQDLYSFGEIKEEGNYVNGLKQGLFKYYNKQGVFEKYLYYEMGQLVQNEEQTKFIEVKKEYDEKGRIKQIGSFRGAVKHGHFQSLDSTGNIILTRIFLNDQPIAEGKFDSLGREVGEWKYFYQNGLVRSIGNFKQGKKQGLWTFLSETGKTEQQGKYDNGLLSGTWKWYYASGNLLREENYRKGKLSGSYMEWADDSIGTILMQGEYLEGLRQGAWKLFVNGLMQEGNYVDGERDGTWVYKKGNILLFTGDFQMGVAVGKHEYFHENGKLESKGEFEGGEKSGDWKHYDEFGNIIQVLTYKQGELVKVNGQKFMK